MKDAYFKANSQMVLDGIDEGGRSRIRFVDVSKSFLKLTVVKISCRLTVLRENDEIFICQKIPRQKYLLF